MKGLVEKHVFDLNVFKQGAPVQFTMGNVANRYGLIVAINAIAMEVLYLYRDEAERTTITVDDVVSNKIILRPMVVEKWNFVRRVR